jgi:hypothetical protein
MKKQIVHEFDAEIATHYSINAAIVFGYFNFRLNNRSYLQLEFEDRYCPIKFDNLQAMYPYMARKTIQNALELLCKGTDKHPALLKRRKKGNILEIGLTGAFKLIQSPHKFDTQLAAKLGVIAAVAYYNISYFIGKNWSKAMTDYVLRLDPLKFTDNQERTHAAYLATLRAAAYTGSISNWLKHRPYVSQRTSERAFAALIDEGLLHKQRGDRHSFKYCWSKKELEKYLATSLNLCGIKNYLPKDIQLPSNVYDGRQMYIEGVKDISKLVLTATASATCKPVVEDLVVGRSADAFGEDIDEDIDEPPSLRSATSSGERASHVEAEDLRSPVEIRKMQEIEANGGEDPDKTLAQKIPRGVVSELHVIEGEEDRLYLSDKGLSALQRKLNRPYYPKAPRKKKTGTRPYHKKIIPDHPDFDDYVDGLTPEQRAAYFASLS